MGIKTIPAVEARVHLGEIMKRAFKEGEHFIVEKSGIPMIAIIDAREYLNLIKEREERFKILETIRAKVPDFSEDKIHEDVDKAITAIRKHRA